MTDQAQASDAGNPAAGGDDLLPDGNDSTLDTSAQGGAQQLPDGDLLSGDEGSGQEGVPEKYTFDVPEGVDVEITDEIQAALQDFSQSAREMGLSQAQYQALVEYDLQRAQAAESAAVDAWNDRVNDWKQSVMKDPEIGGAKYQEARTQALAAIKKFGGNDLASILKNPDPNNPEGLALGNHPAMIRFLSKVGRALGDPTPVDGKETGGSDEQGRLQRMYPSMFEKN